MKTINIIESGQYTRPVIVNETIEKIVLFEEQAYQLNGKDLTEDDLGKVVEGTITQVTKKKFGKVIVYTGNVIFEKNPDDSQKMEQLQIPEAHVIIDDGVNQWLVEKKLVSAVLSGDVIEIKQNNQLLEKYKSEEVEFLKGGTPITKEEILETYKSKEPVKVSIEANSTIVKNN